MANNRVLIDADKLYVPVSAGTVSGSPVMFGQRGGVALTNRDAAGLATVALAGAFRLSVSLAVSAGGAIYYAENADPALRLSTTATGIFFGFALEANAGTGAKLVNVILAESSGISTVGAASLSGTHAALVPADNLIGGVPVVHRFDVADGATADINFVLAQRTQISDAWIVKTVGASSAHAANSIQLQTGAGAAITNAMSLNNVADMTVVRAGTIDDATHVVAAGGTLRIRRSRDAGGTQVACIVYVTGFRIA